MNQRLFLKVRCTGLAAAMLVLIFCAGCGQNSSQNEMAVTTSSDQARKDFLEGRQMFEQVRVDEARQNFDKALEEDPNFALAHLYRAFTATTAMDFQEHLEHALENKNAASEGEQLLIESTKADADDKPAYAVQLLEKLVKQFPNDKRAHLTLGFSYAGLKQYDNAIGEYQRAIQLDANFAGAYNGLGYAYRAKEDYAAAEKAFQDYIRLVPDEANPYDSMADLYLKMGKYDLAIENYKKAAELNPNFAFSQRKIGTCLVFQGKFNEAREAFSSALQMEPTPSGRVVDMGMIALSFVYEGNLGEALKQIDGAFQMAVETGNPQQQASLHSMKCRIYLENGQYDQAMNSLAACIKVVNESNLPEANKNSFIRGGVINKARMAAKQKKFDEALAKAEELKAQISAGDDPTLMEDYHSLMGFISYQKGDYAQAVAHLKEADQENPYDLYQLAAALAGAGEEGEAAKMYEKVANWNDSSLDYALVRKEALTRYVAGR